MTEQHLTIDGYAAAEAAYRQYRDDLPDPMDTPTRAALAHHAHLNGFAAGVEHGFSAAQASKEQQTEPARPWAYREEIEGILDRMGAEGVAFTARQAAEITDRVEGLVLGRSFRGSRAHTDTVRTAGSTPVTFTDYSSGGVLPPGAGGRRVLDIVEAQLRGERYQFGGTASDFPFAAGGVDPAVAADSGLGHEPGLAKPFRRGPGRFRGTLVDSIDPGFMQPDPRVIRAVHKMSGVEIEIGGQRMTEAQFNAARYPLEQEIGKRDEQAAIVARETEEAAEQMDAEDYHAMIPDPLRAEVLALLVGELDDDSAIIEAIGDRFIGVLSTMLAMTKHEALADLISGGARRPVRDALTKVIDEEPENPEPRRREQIRKALGGIGFSSVLVDRMIDHYLDEVLVEHVTVEDVRMTRAQYTAVRNDLLKQLAGQSR